MADQELLVNVEAYLRDTSIEDIVLNPRGIFCYSRGEWRGPLGLLGVATLQEWARKIAEHGGQNLGLTLPTVDAFLAFDADLFFRAHVAIAPLVLEGPVITLRRLPRLEAYALEDFQITGSERQLILQNLREGKSFLLCGKTGSGKTSFLTALLRHVSPHERVLILEDSPEIPLPNPLSTKLLCRNDRFGFRSGAHWDLSHLVFESLRMRPDRLVLGECRGPEAYAMVQALQTGHRGLLATIHAGSPEQALSRFAELAQAHPHHAGADTREVWDVILYLEENAQGQRALKSWYRRP